MSEIESTFSGFISSIGIGIDVLGVAIILIGVVMATVLFLRSRDKGEYIANRYRNYKIQLGQSLLLGLEILVAADIIRTVALGPNFSSLAALGLLMVIRTFLSWTLTLEVERRWPWQPEPESKQETP